MAEAWPGLSGHFRGKAHVFPVRVYYEDTDAGGVVYHARYVAFCERARSECLRLAGIHQSGMQDLYFVVRHMTCEFLRPARLDDLLEIETRFHEMKGARLEIGQKVMLNGNTLFSASVTVALVDGRGRPRRLPEELASRLRDFAESQS
jgi:acyl-CoA thioester hydrolase